MILRSNMFDKPVKGITSLEEAAAVKNRKPDPGQSFYIEIKVPPFMDKDYKTKEYTYNPFRLTCSCEYNLEARNKYKGNDIRKVCRHIYHKLEDKASDLIEPLVMLMLKQQTQRGPEFIVKENENLYTGHIENTPWISVYARQENRWRKFMYNAEEKRYANSGSSA